MSEKDMKNIKELADLSEDTWNKSIAAMAGFASMPFVEYAAFNSTHTLPYAMVGTVSSIVYGVWYGFSDMLYHRKQLSDYKK